MRHRARSRKLSRTSAHRSALYRNMVTSFLDHERIETTDAKAKELRRVAERMITLGKRGTLHARRRAARVIRSRSVAAKVFGDLAERYRERPGGYTRVIKLRHRTGDAAPLSIVELVDGAPAAKAAASGEKPAGRKRKAEGEKGTPAKAAREKASTTRKATARKKTTAKKATGAGATTGKKAATVKKGRATKKPS